MHPSLIPLLTYSRRQAVKDLTRDRRVPVFPAIIDEGLPVFLNIHTHPEYDKTPKTVAGLVEFMRAFIRKTGTPGALTCAPVRVPADDGTVWDGIQFHVDHVADACAYLILIRYVFDEDGRLILDREVQGETDDRILERP